VNDFVGFLVDVEGMKVHEVRVGAWVDIVLTPVRRGIFNASTQIDVVIYSQSLLKHSCPQKKEPRIPSLLRVDFSADSRMQHGATYLLHVGHSSRDGGFPCGQLELWQSTVAEVMFPVKQKFSKSDC
jgi:hypothetical protein